MMMIRLAASLRSIRNAAAGSGLPWSPGIALAVALLASASLRAQSGNQYDLAFRGANEAIARGDLKTAMPLYQAVIADPTAPLPLRLQCRIDAAYCLVWTERRPDAYASLTQVLSHGNDPDPRVRGQVDRAQYFQGQLYMQDGQPADALPLLRELVGRGKAVAPELRVQSLVYIGNMLRGGGDAAGALDRYLAALTECPYVATASEEAVKELRQTGVGIADSPNAEREVRVAAVLAVLRTTLAGHTTEPAYCEALQGAVADVLLNEGRAGEALWEARVYVDAAATATGRDDAIKLLLRATKAADRHLARVNKLLVYCQLGRAGKDGRLHTDDDLADPLADVKPAADPQRDGIYARALAGFGSNWRDRVQRARLYRFWGKPAEALVEAAAALDTCPAEAAVLEEVTSDAAAVLRALGAGPGVGQRLADFRRLGPAGADGAEGTADDLTDPIAEYGNAKVQRAAAAP